MCVTAELSPETGPAAESVSSNEPTSEAAPANVEEREALLADLRPGTGVNWGNLPRIDLAGLSANGVTENPNGNFAPPAFGTGSLTHSGIHPTNPGDCMHTPPPPYPPTARNEGREGVVELAVEINPTGQANAVVLVRSSGYDDLDRVAKETVLSKWRFVPDNTGNAHRQIVRVAFELTSARG